MAIQDHNGDYTKNGDAWRDLTLVELGQWVHLLAQRSAFRTRQEKRDKDLADAQVYLSMMQVKLNDLKR